MKLKNEFTEKDRSLWIFRHDCDYCGSNKNLELHHIFGRISNSPLNGSLLCNSCHYRHHSQKPFNFEENKTLLQKTLKWLFKQGYKLTKKDEQFILDNYKFYVDDPRQKKGR